MSQTIRRSPSGSPSLFLKQSKRSISRRRVDDPLGLYIHIPFCRKRCHFCYFKVYTDKKASEIEIYLDALIKENEIYSRMPAFQGRKLRFAYFGGGTPSYISEKQLHYLVDGLNRHVSWANAEEVTFECEPGTLQKSKLETLKEIGVTRLSLGIEHFDDEILAANGRAHLSPEIYRAYEWARQVDFPQVNIDLIAGMMGETEEKWRDAVKRAIDLEPDSVTIYQMELPYNTFHLAGHPEEGHRRRRLPDGPPNAAGSITLLNSFSRTTTKLQALTSLRQRKRPAGLFTGMRSGMAAT